MSEIRDLKETIRPNALKALSALAKFLGVHEEYKQLIRDYGLKWCSRSAEDLIIDRMTKIENPNEVFEWIKQVKSARARKTINLGFASPQVKSTRTADNHALVLN